MKIDLTKTEIEHVLIRFEKTGINCKTCEKLYTTLKEVVGR